MRKTTAPLALGLMAYTGLVQAQDLKGEVSIWSWNIAASSLESVAKDFMAANPG
jgi:lactose/L-arabinose transport system substrate-binding protein